MRSTMADVARLARVSTATVSYVLNDTKGQTISPETRESVLAAAEKLGYRAHPGARSLRTGRSDIVLFPLPDLVLNHIFASMVNACSVALARNHLTLVTDFTAYPDVEAQVAAWQRLGPAAVIDLLIPDDSELSVRFQRAGMTVITAQRIGDGPVTPRPMDSVTDAARARQVEYLLSRGHERIVYAMPTTIAAEHNDPSRLVEMRALADRAGAQLTFQAVEPRAAAIVETVRRWTETELPDAVCAYNDEFAVSLITAAHRVGLEVPDDVAVIGVDDDPIAVTVTPALTSVAWSVEQLGQSIADATSAALTSGHRSHAFPLPDLSIVERDSA